MYYWLVLSILLLSACSTPEKKAALSPLSKREESNDHKRAKFEPENGKVLLFVGQELEAIGGLDNYNAGYLDHFATPAGFTMYTNLSPGDTSLGYVNKGLDGIYNTANWGDGPSNTSFQLADPDFNNMALAIGLSMVNHEKQIAIGKHDSLIVTLGKFIASLGDRPVFLRIGYEFDGHTWNHYDKQNYKTAFKRIHHVLDSLGVNNVAYVWQSTGWVSTTEQLEAWYPGDEYVDWCAYSFFSRFDEAKMIKFARIKGKPVFIAEASPTISDEMAKFNGQTKETILSNPEEAREAWKKWFVPFFRTIQDNPDIVKAVSYINSNWKSQPMWKENPAFQHVDARLYTSDMITEKWIEETSKECYLKSSSHLFDDLR